MKFSLFLGFFFSFLSLTLIFFCASGTCCCRWCWVFVKNLFSGCLLFVLVHMCIFCCLPLYIQRSKREWEMTLWTHISTLTLDAIELLKSIIHIFYSFKKSVQRQTILHALFSNKIYKSHTHEITPTINKHRIWFIQKMLKIQSNHIEAPYKRYSTTNNNQAQVICFDLKIGFFYSFFCAFCLSVVWPQNKRTHKRLLCTFSVLACFLFHFFFFGLTCVLCVCAFIYFIDIIIVAQK